MSVRGRLAGMKRVRRRAMALTMLFSLLVPKTALPVRVSAKAPVLRYDVSGDLTAPRRTREELQRRWDALCVPERRYGQEPCVRAPYQTGALHADFLRQNLELVNLFRYSAGLSFVSSSEADNLSAQYGAVLLAGTNTLEHSPKKPADMDGAFYQKALDVLGASNISRLRYAGTVTEQQKCASAAPRLCRDYMDDAGAFNRSCLPHRRWILYPSLQTVGIGCADARDGTVYQVLKVMGTQRSGAAQTNYDFVAWPASGVFPAQVISPGSPWSVSLNPGKFRIPARDELTVTITRETDGKVWKLDAASSRSGADDRFLLVDTQRYGVGNCILFAFGPAEENLYSSAYRVTVTGLKTIDGDAAMLDYRIEFADMEDNQPACSNDSCPSRRFADAPPRGNWAHEGVDFVLERGIFSGTGRDTFSPKGSMTRAMMVTVLWRMAGMPEPAGSCPFADVRQNAYYADAVGWAAETGLVKGLSADRFGPDGLLTRAQAVTLLKRFCAPQERGPEEALDGFADGASVANYARDAFGWAIEQKIITGQNGADGRLRLLPEDRITREQAATILMRCMMEQ